MGETRTNPTTPDQGSGTRPRVSDARLDDLFARRNLGPGISHNEVADMIDDLRDARATAARYEAALQAMTKHVCFGCDACEVARRALSSGGSGEAKGREA